MESQLAGKDEEADDDTIEDLPKKSENIKRHLSQYAKLRLLTNCHVNVFDCDFHNCLCPKATVTQRLVWKRGVSKRGILKTFTYNKPRFPCFELQTLD